MIELELHLRQETVRGAPVDASKELPEGALGAEYKARWNPTRDAFRYIKYMPALHSRMHTYMRT